MTAKETVEAIQALTDGEWDNPLLEQIGELSTDYEDNVTRILSLYVPD